MPRLDYMLHFQRAALSWQIHDHSDALTSNIRSIFYSYLVALDSLSLVTRLICDGF